MASLSSGYVLCGPASSIPSNTSKLISFTSPSGESVEVGLYNINNQFYAIDDLCTHKQAHLTQGDMEDLPQFLEQHEKEGGVSMCVRCPKHRKKFCGGLYFNVASGRAFTKGSPPPPKFDPKWKVATFEVKQVDGNVYVGTTPTNGVKLGGDKDTMCGAILVDIKRYNHDSFIYTFKLDAITKDDVKQIKDKKTQKQMKALGMAYFKLTQKISETEFECWHLDLRSPTGSVTREYTPISTWETFRTTQKIELLIKLYPQGSMSNVLATSSVSQKFFVGMPKKTIPTQILQSSSLACIAGGTGITPFYQLFTYVAKLLKEGKNGPRITLLYSNKKKEDILLYDNLQEFQKEYPKHFTIVYTLTREENTEENKLQLMGYLCGRVSYEMIKKYLPSTSHDHAFVSGPSGMWSSVLPLLKECGYSESKCTELEA
eukprot:TRINITY_DN1975_c0_g3_i1.p1 TRINITY_DN1975_c0_g3~~TRINITY_DN1975_c0_g3_i1.p1  ORF type:complete len:430 (-),score=93.24 TRINITY_DN1975_c0_g3_i1:134-1423(-)